jgi:hypothetical protein
MIGGWCGRVSPTPAAETWSGRAQQIAQRKKKRKPL